MQLGIHGKFRLIPGQPGGLNSMSLAPKSHLNAYRVNAGQNQIIFGVAGSNVNVISGLTVNSGGTYTSKPTVTISGGGGTGGSATANMGANSVSITPGIVGSAVSPGIASVTGSGAVLSPVYGGVSISGVADVYLNPSATPAPSIGVSGGGGSGATYSLSYEVATLTFSQPGSTGQYTSAATLSVSPAGSGFVGGIRYGYATLTITAGVGQSNLFETAGSVPAITSNGPGSGLSITSTFAPRLFVSYGGSVDLYWHTANPAPTISQVAGWATGSGATYVAKFGIHELQVGNVGNSDYDDTVDLEVGGITIGTIGFDAGTGDLDPTTINISDPNYGYFGSGAVPAITLVPRGNGTGGAISVSKCRLKRIEASGGTGYTATDIDNFQDLGGRLTSTGLKNSSGSSALLDSSPFRLLVAERISTTITNGGSGFDFTDSLDWQGPGWVTLSNGDTAGSDAPAISSRKKISGVEITSPGTFTTSPTFTFSSPSSGTTPTLTLAAAKIISVSNTGRGSGYSATQTLVLTNLYKDSSLSQAATSSDFSVSGPWLASISVVTPGVGYAAGDVVQYGFGNGSVATLRVVSLNITGTGTGYSSAPTISFSGGGQTVSASATATIALVTASASALPLIIASDANPSAGDARKIAYAIADCFFNIFASGQAGVRVAATRSYSNPSTSLDRTVTYKFSFLVRKSGNYAVKNEP